MIVVDAAPIIYLSRIGNLSLLRKLYDKLLIPQGVWDEVVTQAHGRPGASETTRGVEEGWVKTERVLPEKSLRAEGAEGADAEAIALAKKTNLPLLTNDKALATIAKTHGVRVKWLTQAIIEATQRKIITPAQARALIRDLVREGLRVRSDVLAEVIHRIEETHPANGNLQVKTVHPEDPIFTRPPVAKRTGKKERTSTEHDRILYGETSRSS